MIYEVIDRRMIGGTNVVIKRPILADVEKQAREKIAAKQLKQILKGLYSERALEKSNES